jgi:hypothetical protein
MLRRPGHGPSTSRIMTYRPPAITDQPHPAQRKAAATLAWWQTSGTSALPMLPTIPGSPG